MTDVSGKTAFITGGANGIGLGIARALGSRGARIGLADLDLAALDLAREELAQITDVEIVPLDVRDRTLFAEAVDRIEHSLGPISLLVNNAGVAGSGGISDLTFEDWDWSIAINLWGVINGVQILAPRMMERGGQAHIVNTASASGLVGGTATMPYCAAKFAVVGLSEALRAELAESEISVSLLCPGPVATEILANSAVTKNAAGKQEAGLSRTGISNVLQFGASPDAVGEAVAQAIEAEQFYIHSDRTILASLEDRHKEIVAAMPEGDMNEFTRTMSKTLLKKWKG